MIYAYCFNLSGIEKWFDAFWKILESSPKPSKAKTPLVYKNTPGVLLICKQVYLEAREVLKKQSISFHHGMLDIISLESVMNPSILTNISKLTIDATGHEIIHKAKGLVGPSWRGHLDLIVDISEILSQGHRLKIFTLDFTDKTLKSHVHDCWFKPIRCDFRDQLTEALQHLRKVRSVGTVNLIGIPPSMIPDLKARMESSPLSLLDMPGEIRNQIYDYAADWSDISTQLTRTMKAWARTDPTRRPRRPTQSAPPLLSSC